LLRGGCLLLFVVALGTVGGCGTKGPKSSVSGKVTLNGQNVAGQVTFVGADNKELSSPIREDGSYLIENPPTGSVKVLVKGMTSGGPAPMTPKTPGMPSMPDMPGAKGVAPPAKYGSVATTPLTFEVTGGKQTYDIPLAP